MADNSRTFEYNVKFNVKNIDAIKNALSKIGATGFKDLKNNEYLITFKTEGLEDLENVRKVLKDLYNNMPDLGEKFAEQLEFGLSTKALEEAKKELERLSNVKVGDGIDKLKKGFLDLAKEYDNINTQFNKNPSSKLEDKLNATFNKLLGYYKGLSTKLSQSDLANLQKELSNLKLPVFDDTTKTSMLDSIKDIFTNIGSYIEPLKLDIIDTEAIERQKQIIKDLEDNIKRLQDSGIGVGTGSGDGISVGVLPKINVEEFISNIQGEIDSNPKSVLYIDVAGRIQNIDGFVAEIQNQLKDIKLDLGLDSIFKTENDNALAYQNRLKEINAQIQELANTEYETKMSLRAYDNTQNKIDSRIFDDLAKNGWSMLEGRPLRATRSHEKATIYYKYKNFIEKYFDTQGGLFLGENTYERLPEFWNIADELDRTSIAKFNEIIYNVHQQLKTIGNPTNREGNLRIGNMMDFSKRDELRTLLNELEQKHSQLQQEQREIEEKMTAENGKKSSMKIPISIEPTIPDSATLIETIQAQLDGLEPKPHLIIQVKLDENSSSTIQSQLDGLEPKPTVKVGFGGLTDTFATDIQTAIDGLQKDILIKITPDTSALTNIISSITSGFSISDIIKKITNSTAPVILQAENAKKILASMNEMLNNQLNSRDRTEWGYYGNIDKGNTSGVFKGGQGMISGSTLREYRNRTDNPQLHGHTHPERFAAFSDADLRSFAHEYQTTRGALNKEFVIAEDELATFDLSQLSDEIIIKLQNFEMRQDVSFRKFVGKLTTIDKLKQSILSGENEGYNYISRHNDTFSRMMDYDILKQIPNMIDQFSSLQELEDELIRQLKTRYPNMTGRSSEIRDFKNHMYEVFRDSNGLDFQQEWREYTFDQLQKKVFDGTGVNVKDVYKVRPISELPNYVAELTGTNIQQGETSNIFQQLIETLKSSLQGIKIGVEPNINAAEFLRIIQESLNGEPPIQINVSPNLPRGNINASGVSAFVDALNRLSPTVNLTSIINDILRLNRRNFPAILNDIARSITTLTTALSANANTTFINQLINLASQARNIRNLANVIVNPAATHNVSRNTMRGVNATLDPAEAQRRGNEIYKESNRVIESIQRSANASIQSIDEFYDERHNLVQVVIHEKELIRDAEGRIINEIAKNWNVDYNLLNNQAESINLQQKDNLAKGDAQNIREDRTIINSILKQVRGFENTPNMSVENKTELDTIKARIQSFVDNVGNITKDEFDKLIQDVNQLEGRVLSAFNNANINNNALLNRLPELSKEDQKRYLETKIIQDQEKDLVNTPGFISKVSSSDALFVKQIDDLFKDINTQTSNWTANLQGNQNVIDQINERLQAIKDIASGKNLFEIFDTTLRQAQINAANGSNVYQDKFNTLTGNISGLTTANTNGNMAYNVDAILDAINQLRAFNDEQKNAENQAIKTTDKLKEYARAIKDFQKANSGKMSWIDENDLNNLLSFATQIYRNPNQYSVGDINDIGKKFKEIKDNTSNVQKNATQDNLSNVKELKNIQEKKYDYQLAKLRQLKAADDSRIQLSQEELDLIKEMEDLFVQLEQTSSKFSANLKGSQGSIDAVNKEIKNVLGIKDNTLLQREFESAKKTFEGRTNGKNTYTPALTADINNLKGQLVNFKLDINTEDGQKKVLEMIKLMSDLSAKTKEPSNILRDGESSLDKYSGKINEILSRYTGMSTELRNRFINLNAEINNLKNNSNEMTDENITNIRNQFLALNNEMTRTGQNTTSFFTTIGNRIKDMNAKMIAMYFSWYRVIGYIKKAISNVSELDKALTEMRKVSEENVATLKQYQKLTFDIAESVGTTAAALQNSTADWMRLGETLSQASESARQSTILMNVSEFQSIDEATKSLVSLSQAYKELDKATIVDKLNEVGKIKIAYLYSNIMKIKVAISVKNQRWSRPRKELDKYLIIRRDCNTLYGNI